MTWTIEVSRDADRFIQAQGLQDETKRLVHGFLRKLLGESVNIDVKKLKGEWGDYLRIRKGKLRIIFSMDPARRSVYVERVDFRGDVYK